MRSAICMIVRNEERHIEEWIAYHWLIGFRSFIIYDNQSDDRTAVLLDRLRRFIDIKVIDWSPKVGNAQLAAYDDCLKNFAFSYDWIAFIDSDEFIFFPENISINEFLGDFQHADAIVLNWAIFGSGGHVEIPPGLILEEFTQRADDEFPINLHTKVIVRPEKAIKVTDPHHIEVEGNAVKADGTPFTRKTIGVSETLAGFTRCHINHYFVKSQAHWAKKMERGYKWGHRPSDHFATHDRNERVDRSAAVFAPFVRDFLAAMDLCPLREERNSDATGPKETRVALSDVLYRAPILSCKPDNELFDPSFYLKAYDDVRASGMDPFKHFQKFGYYEGRRPCCVKTFRQFVLSRIRTRERIDISPKIEV